MEGREQRSPGPRIYSNSCQNLFGFLKNNHNSWVKNQFVTRRQPQSEPPQGETGVPDRVLQPYLCCSLNPRVPNPNQSNQSWVLATQMWDGSSWEEGRGHVQQVPENMAQGQLHPCDGQLCSQPRLQSSSLAPGSDGACMEVGRMEMGRYISSGCRPGRWAHWQDSPTEGHCLGMAPLTPPLTTWRTETTLSSHPLLARGER